MPSDPREIAKSCVNAVTLSRQAAVVLVAVAACGAPPSSTPDDASALRTDAAADGGAPRGDAGSTEPPVVVPPAEPLCALVGPPELGPEDVLVFEDEFEGTTVDPAKWSLRDGYRRTGILNHASAAHVTVEDGVLRVSATPNASPKDALYPYDAGFADTLGKFARTYGRVEFRARFPYEPGVWFAIWGKPWSRSFPELDIEVVNRPGAGKSQLYFVHHWAAPPLPADERRAYAMFQDEDYSVFRTYTLDWKPDALTWSVDGETKMTVTGEHVPTLPVYWMINAWVGGWTGAPTAETKFPTTFEVDWMRVWRTDGLLADPLVQPTGKVRESYRRGDWLDVSVANFDEACAHVELHEGSQVLWRTSIAPYRVPLAVLTEGVHDLRLVVTDGVRRAETSFTTTIR